MAADICLDATTPYNTTMAPSRNKPSSNVKPNISSLQSNLIQNPLYKIITCNIEGLLPRNLKYKHSMLSEMSQNDNFLAICLNESHLKPLIRDAKVHMDGMVGFRTDRLMGRKKGGVTTNVRENLASLTEVTLSYSTGFVEILALVIKPLYPLGHGTLFYW